MAAEDPVDGDEIQVGRSLDDERDPGEHREDRTPRPEAETAGGEDVADRRVRLAVPLPRHAVQVDDHGEAMLRVDRGIRLRRDRGREHWMSLRTGQDRGDPDEEEDGRRDRGPGLPRAGSAPGSDVPEIPDQVVFALLLVGSLTRAPAQNVLEPEPPRLHRLDRLEHAEDADLVDEGLLERVVLAEPRQELGAAARVDVFPLAGRDQVDQVLVHEPDSFRMHSRSN